MSKTHYLLHRLGVFVVAIHFLIGLAHGVAHSRLHIELNLWQTVYVLLVITLLPLISGFLLWRAASKRGFLLLLASMLGALLFGGYYHFIAVGADNVASLGSHSWAPPFQLTAALLAITEAVGALTGLFGLLRSKR